MSDALVPSSRDSVPLCHRPWTGFELYDHLGDVRPCCWGKISCGNVNLSSPAEIWSGVGFRFYRDRMTAGDTDAICRPECPILQGHYREVLHDVPGSTDRNLEIPASPKFLRVVPTTSCNLTCEMCYQKNDPPARLPADLFERLRPWLLLATELLILGGEPLISRECLAWLERATPEEFPGLKVAVITNAYGFPDSTVRLMEKREWSWILASIDAASPAVYRRVRSGDFRVLRVGLDRLARLRAALEANLELRFGFTIQRDNVGDMLPFLDLCEEYSAVPQYTLVGGDDHRQSFRSAEDRSGLREKLEVLDKELAMRGHSGACVSGVLAKLGTEPRSDMQMELPRVQFVRVDDDSSALRAAKLLRDSKTMVVRSTSEFVPPRETLLADVARAKNMRCDAFALDFDLPRSYPASDADEWCVRVVSNGDPWAWINVIRWRRNPDLLRSALRLGAVRRAVIQLPYWEDERAISAIEWREDVRKLVAHLYDTGVREVVGYPDVEALGGTDSDTSPDATICARRGVEGLEPVVSVIAPAYNAAASVGPFLASLQAQRGAPPMEVILVDDGSTDDTAQVAATCFNQFADLQGAVITLRRDVPYVPGTFSFRAGLARDVACTYARGKLLVFIDPDQIADERCIAEHVRWWRAGFQVIIGDRRYVQGNRPIGVRENLHWLASRYTKIDVYTWWMSFFTGNAAVDARHFFGVGGFDGSLQFWGLDDTDLGYRLAHSGARAWHTNRAVVTHAAHVESGGGSTAEEFRRAFRLHMEVLYRKYLDESILEAHRFVW